VDASLDMKKTVLGISPEGMNERSRSTTDIAFDPQIFGLKRSTSFEKAECAFAGRKSTVYEPMPWEIIEVTISASKKKTCRHCVRMRALLTTRMQIVGLVWAIWIFF